MKLISSAIFVMALSLMSFNTHPMMRTVLSRKNLTTTGISIVIAHVGVYGTHYYRDRKRAQHLPDANPHVQDIAHQELARRAFQNPDSIIVKVDPKLGHPNAYVCTQSNYIFITEDYNSSIEKKIEEGAYDDPLVDEFRAVIHHEASHHLNRDVARLFGVEAVVGFFLSVSTSLLTLKFPGFSRIDFLARIPLQMAAVVAYGRHREQCADDGIPNDEKLLQAGYNFHKKFLGYDPNLLERMYATHPTPAQRAARFKKRLDELDVI